MRDSEFLIRVHPEKRKGQSQGAEAREERSLMSRVKDFFQTSSSNTTDPASARPNQQSVAPPPVPPDQTKTQFDHPLFVDGGLVRPVQSDGMSMVSSLSPSLDDTPTLNLTIRGEENVRTAFATGQRRRQTTITPSIVAAGPSAIFTPAENVELEDTHRNENQVAGPETAYGSIPIRHTGVHEVRAHYNHAERGYVKSEMQSNGVKFIIRAPAHIDAGLPSNVRVVLAVVHTGDARVKVYPRRTGAHLPTIRRSIIDPPGLEGVYEPQQPLRLCQCSAACTEFGPSHLTEARWRANIAIDSLRHYKNGRGPGASSLSPLCPAANNQSWVRHFLR